MSERYRTGSLRQMLSLNTPSSATKPVSVATHVARSLPYVIPAQQSNVHQNAKPDTAKMRTSLAKTMRVSIVISPNVVKESRYLKRIAGDCGLLGFNLVCLCHVEHVANSEPFRLLFAFR